MKFDVETDQVRKLAWNFSSIASLLTRKIIETYSDTAEDVLGHNSDASDETEREVVVVEVQS